MLEDFLTRFETIGDVGGEVRVIEDSGRAKIDLDPGMGDVKTVTFGKSSADWIYRTARPKRGNRGLHEPGLIAALMALGQVDPRPGRVLFDLGCAHGYVALMARAVGGFDRVLGVEMNPRLVRLARRNAELNPRLSDGVEVVHGAVCDTAEAKALCLFKGPHIVVRPTDFALRRAPKKGLKEIRLDLLTVDSLVANRGLVPDVIKIDVDGAHDRALTGAANTLRRHRPVVFVEGNSSLSVNYDGVPIKAWCRRMVEDFDYQLVAIDHRARPFDPQLWSVRPEDWPGKDMAIRRMMMFLPNGSGA